MIALALAAILSQAPAVPYDPANTPPRIIDEHGSIRPLIGVVLPNGTECLTPGKAKSVRDDLVAKNAELAVLRAEPGWKTSTVLIVAGVALAVGAAAGAGIAVAVKK